MKFITTILKLLSAITVLMVTAIIFMLVTANYLPRLNGANYYDHGCSDGVAYLLTEDYSDGLAQKAKKAREYCSIATKRLREKGYLL